jgi:hypothetical protein
MYLSLTLAHFCCHSNGDYKRFNHEAKKTRACSNRDHILITRTSRDTGSFF